jgi:RTX calcium-binding nonapeptide repeat (4 copies)/Cadherin-like domain
MTVIDIQRTRGKVAEPKGRERFEIKTAEKPSRKPFFLGFSLAALVLYMKSAVGANSTHDAQKPHHAPQHDGHSPNLSDDVTAQASDNANVVAFQEASQRLETKPLNLPTQSSAAQHLSALQTPDSAFDISGLRYNAPSQGLGRSFGSAVRFPVTPQNDNSLSAQSANAVAVVRANAAPTEAVAYKRPLTARELNNHAPVSKAATKLADVYSNDVASITVADLLLNFVDEDKTDKLGVLNVTVNGEALVYANGRFALPHNVVGPIEIKYQVSDGIALVDAKATANVLAQPTFTGTSADDTLNGTAHSDVMKGGDGKDVIDGKAGDDTIDGGCGNDTLTGGDGKDVINGGNGNDTLYGGAGDDVLSGGSGNDRLFGNAGNDSLNGGSGRDWLYDGFGIDKVNGGSGNDTVIAEADSQNDDFDGGTGVDKLSYALATKSVTIDVAKGTVTGADSGTDAHKHFEIFQGGKANDKFIAALNPEPANITSSNAGGTPTLATDPSPTARSETVSTPTLAQDVGTNFNPDARAQTATSPMGEDTAVSFDPATRAQTATAVVVGNTYIGGAGVNTLDYSAAKTTITIDMSHGTATGVQLNGDYFEQMQNFVTGSGDDHFIATGHGTQEHLIITDEIDTPEPDADCASETAADNSSNPVVDISTQVGTAAVIIQNQSYSGGTGYDTLSYQDADKSVAIDTSLGKATGAEIGTDIFDGIEHFIGGNGADLFTVAGGTYTLEGGAGRDEFLFVTATGQNANVHIAGFEVGDWVQMSKFDIFDDPTLTPDQNFQAVYTTNDNSTPSQTGLDQVTPIHVRHEVVDGVGKTYIDADLNNDGTIDVSIQIDGDHHLHVLEAHVA